MTPSESADLEGAGLSQCTKPRVGGDRTKLLCKCGKLLLMTESLHGMHAARERQAAVSASLHVERACGKLLQPHR